MKYINYMICTSRIREVVYSIILQASSFQLIERKRTNNNMYTNAAFLETPLDPSWKEIPRSAIELFDVEQIPGAFGATVVRGSLSFPLGSRKMDCSIKTLKSKFLC